MIEVPAYIYIRRDEGIADLESVVTIDVFGEGVSQSDEIAEYVSREEVEKIIREAEEWGYARAMRLRMPYKIDWSPKAE